MAKARAIVRRRKAVRNIRKITRTMQMIATAKYQKSLKRAVGTKPYTLKVRELVRELAASVGNVEHPLLRRPTAETRTGRVALVVLVSNRGLAGAYNGSVLRTAQKFIKAAEARGETVDLYISGKKGIAYFTFLKQKITGRYDQFGDDPAFVKVQEVADQFITDFVAGKLDAVHVCYMNFISAGKQKPEVMTLLPLAGVTESVDHLAQQAAENDAQVDAGMLDSAHQRAATVEAHKYDTQTTYDFSPDPKTLLDALLPLTVKSALFQAFLDATTSEHVARMVAMKSASDNADQMVKSLTMQYNRARQSQITTELSEIMGGVESMKK